MFNCAKVVGFINERTLFERSVTPRTSGIVIVNLRAEAQPGGSANEDQVRVDPPAAHHVALTSCFTFASSVQFIAYFAVSLGRVYFATGYTINKMRKNH